jgi:hypothetical protein
MKLFSIICGVLLLAAGVRAAIPFTYGHAAYTYAPLQCASDPCEVVPSCNRAHWAADIGNYNNAAATNGKINIVYAYGGDIEFWANAKDPQGCWAPASNDLNVCNVSVFFDPNNAKAAEVYQAAPGVDTVVALLDGRLDGWDQIQTYNGYDGCKFGDFYPNLVNLTDFALQRLATDTAKLYCKSPVVSGMQVDLEPYKDPYKPAVQKFIKYVGAALLDADGSNGCRTSKFPQGRTVSYFTFAHNHKPSFMDDLGPNGYFVFSGYDLADQIWPADPTFKYNTIPTYKTRLRQEITYIRPLIGYTGKFTMAFPMAASCHEYEQYVPMKGQGCGPACTPYTNTVRMIDYVNAIFEVLLDPATTNSTDSVFCLDEANGGQFLGLSWWTWTYTMTYPPMKWFDNVFLPPTPSSEVLSALAANLPKLTTVTCNNNKPSSCSQVVKPTGCSCTHSWDCSSNNCAGIPPTCQ